MSGHNKWSKIKHKKGAEDAKKSKIFSMLSRQIAIEARAGGGDKNSPRLRAIIEKARKANMPSENIDRAIAKATGAGANEFEEVLYEAYGPGGVALVIEGITDNKNRTSAEVRHLLTEKGISVGTPGSVLWAFERIEEEGALTWKPKSTIPLSPPDSEKLQMLIEEIEEHDDIKRVFTNEELTQNS